MLWVHTDLKHQLSQSIEAPLAAFAIIELEFITLVCGVLLVDAVISQMHEFCLFAAAAARTILASGKTDQTFIVQVNPKRINACNGHVYTHVELVSVQEEWVRDVLGHYIVVFAILLWDLR